MKSRFMPLRKLRRWSERVSALWTSRAIRQPLVSVTLRLDLDEGGQRHRLSATVRLPGVPRAGEWVRAGEAGDYFEVDRVIWDEGDVAVRLKRRPDGRHHVEALLRSGWQVR